MYPKQNMMALFALCLMTSLGCSAPATTVDTSGATVVETTREVVVAPDVVEPAAPEAIAARAKFFTDLASDIEPRVTTMLVELAGAMNGEMFKLQYRLKTLKSSIRKIRKYLIEKPELTISTVSIDDALRYTMVFRDVPPGNHTLAVFKTLSTLENAGHKVKRVKNYWPKGDNYSGINSVLVAPEGLEWELQFHTPESVIVQTKTRPLYEEMRKVSTNLGRKRKLFADMSRLWENVPIPEDVLTPHSLHTTEEILARPSP